ncbi:MAG: hypothetical protein ACPLXP_02590 [Microgenomates group bacterium]
MKKISPLKLTNSKLRALSGIFANFSEVFLASMVIPIFFAKVDLGRIIVLILGVALTLISALLALMFAEKGKI